ncbi:MAG: hypothetical protein ACK5T0_00465 [Vampirovibrionales bacterium]
MSPKAPLHRFMQKISSFPAPIASPTPKALQRNGINPKDFAQQSKLLTATFLKFGVPIGLSTASGASVYNVMTWPLVLGGMGISYGGGLLAKELMKDVMEHPPTPSVSTEILMNFNRADFSGLFLDGAGYEQLGTTAIKGKEKYRSKYEYFLKQVNHLGGHWLGLFDAVPPYERGQKHDALMQKALARYQHTLQHAKHKPLSQQAHPMLAFHFQQKEDMPFLARGINGFLHFAPVRWVTSTPIFLALVPKVDGKRGTLDQVDSWISNIPVFGAVLDSKAKALSQAKDLYFRTNPKGNLEDLKLSHGQAFQRHIKMLNQGIEQKNKGLKTPLPLLPKDDATFREYLHLLSRHEKQTAVRLALYKTFFDLFAHKDLGMLLKVWHDVDGMALRSMFDIAQCLDPKKGFVWFLHNLFNETYATLANGGFATLMQFGTSLIPPPFNGFARFLGDAFMLSFDIRLKPLTKQTFGYHGEDLSSKKPPKKPPN